MERKELVVLGANPGEVPFGSFVEERLRDPGLREALLASAYLTVPAAEQLCLWLATRRAEKTRPRVRLLFGTMNHFTRRKAIDLLLKETRLLNADVEVIQPVGNRFHLKYFFAHVGREFHAAIGSHNATGSGFDSVGELGVVLSGGAARRTRLCLDTWLQSSVPWRKGLDSYKEAKRVPADLGSDPGSVAQGAGDVLGTVAEVFNASGLPLSKRDRQIQERLWKRLSRYWRNLHHAPIQLDGTTAHEARQMGYAVGACFDYSEHFLKGKPEYFEKQRRQVWMVAHVEEVSGRTLVFTRRKPVRTYKLTSALMKFGRELGIHSQGRPSAEAFRRFIAAIDREKGRAQRARGG